MRKSVFFILLATAAIPAMAAGPDREGRGGDRAEARAAARAEPSERGGGERAQHSQRSERAAEVQNAAPAQNVERVRTPRGERSQALVQSGRSNHQSSDQRSGRRNWTGNRSGDGVRPAPVVVRDSSESVTNWRARERRVPASPNVGTDTGSTRSRYNGREGSRTNWGDRSVEGRTSSVTTRSGSWRDGGRDDHTRRWTSNWRNDRRYNWRNHRSHYSSVYRLGRYHDPFGYGYRRFSIGFNLWPSYYGSNYWLSDPWQYRLPPAYGPYRWIRYYDDALLVDIYSGEVVDVIHNFFW